MDAPQFKEFAKEMVDYVSNYLENIRDRRVLPTVEPGYLRPLIPETAPIKGDKWEDVLADVERVIMPGVTHWHSPRFHAYFPTANSYPAIVADILSGAIACIGFSWIASPACTELEVVMLDWLAQSHSSVERAGLLGGVKLRSLPVDDEYKLRGETVAEALKEDKAAGLIPFYLVATLGTTSSCAFDSLDEIGPICNEYGVWLHVDAAYAGSSFICPEFRYLMKGIERADSFNFNPHKWLLVNFDCSTMWLKEPAWLVDAFNVDPLYLKHDQQGAAPDYRHWQIPLGRRFRALKLWFVLRLYGVENLQAFIRKHIALAHYFEELVRSDDRFEIAAEVIMGLVCFRLKGENELSEQLLKRINANGVVHMVPSKINDIYFLRMAVCSRFTEREDIEITWKEVRANADLLLSEKKN
ncbi:group ii pyridoxal-5-phosphate decarboxylase [Holotrichia oblita]|uniref:Group ii pyridoxal-5-phosphate decarboxylase n=1 Tax=Holotrichia oblita TaxID=644536 RepID=A0ACB9TBR6_HOLOL|nr:group ii pyridoxal-5-phosphate decarboxylase [Holotrichia oblita]